MIKNISIGFISLFLSIFTFEFLHAENSYFESGKKLFNNKKFTDSRFYFEKDIVSNPKSENSYLYLAKIFKNEKKEDLEKNNLNTVLLQKRGSNLSFNSTKHKTIQFFKSWRTY